MPKMKWGVDAEEIGNAESRENNYYNGPALPRGVYDFAVAQMKATESKKREDGGGGNPMIKLLLLVANKGKFNGAPVWDQVVVMSKTAWKVRQLCDALGVDYNDFADKTVVDADGNITKIGKVKITEDTLLRAATKTGKDQQGDPRPEIAQYIAWEESDDDDEGDDGDDDDGDDGDDDAPF